MKEANLTNFPCLKQSLTAERSLIALTSDKKTSTMPSSYICLDLVQMSNEQDNTALSLKNRFRGFMPVVVDIETGGFNPKTDAILEIAAVTLHMNEQGLLLPKETISKHIEPFASANLDPKALEFTKIDPFHPFRFAVSEEEALKDIFQFVRTALKEQDCNRAVLVGHNPAFDISFLNAAVTRTEIKRNPFHAFTTFDTASLSAVAFGQTVLRKAIEKAGITFDNNQAHSAKYDAEKTAELFCCIVNQWQTLA